MGMGFCRLTSTRMMAFFAGGERGPTCAAQRVSLTFANIAGVVPRNLWCCVPAQSAWSQHIALPPRGLGGRSAEADSFASQFWGRRVHPTKASQHELLATCIDVDLEKNVQHAQWHKYTRKTLCSAPTRALSKFQLCAQHCDHLPPPPPDVHISETAFSHRFQKVYTPPPRNKSLAQRTKSSENPQKVPKPTALAHSECPQEICQQHVRAMDVPQDLVHRCDLCPHVRGRSFNYATQVFIPPPPQGCIRRGGARGVRGVWLGPLLPGSPYGPRRRPRRRAKLFFKPKSSWHRRHRSKILAFSLKHWKGRKGGVPPPPLLRCTAVLIHPPPLFMCIPNPADLTNATQTRRQIGNLWRAEKEFEGVAVALDANLQCNPMTVKRDASSNHARLVVPVNVLRALYELG